VSRNNEAIRETAIDLIEDLLDGGDFDEEAAIDAVADLLAPAMDRAWVLVRLWLVDLFTVTDAERLSRETRRAARKARRAARKARRKEKRDAPATQE